MSFLWRNFIKVNLEFRELLTDKKRKKKRASMSQKADMQKLEDEFEKKKRESGSREVPLPSEPDSSKKRKSAFSPIARAFGVEVRDQLDQEIARMFYSAGLPFNLARNPHYHRSYQFAAINKIDGYVLPVIISSERTYYGKKETMLITYWNLLN